MKIDVSFTVPVPPQDAWPLLLDVPRIVPCLPGASLTDALGDNRYKGQATVKVGPTVTIRVRQNREFLIWRDRERTH